MGHRLRSKKWELEWQISKTPTGLAVRVFRKWSPFYDIFCEVRKKEKSDAMFDLALGRIPAFIDF